LVSRKHDQISYWFVQSCGAFCTFSFEKAKKCSSENANDNAIVHLTKAIALVPDEISFYVARGDCYLRLCDIQSAILNYRKACLMQPGSYVHRLAFLYYMNAEFYLEQKMYVEALENFTQASEIQPDSAGYRIRR
jgi:tetratricopeptide (TPR) repeat protein